MTLEERIYSGNRAREILENEVFAQAMADIKQEVINQWQQSPARDSEAREKLWMMLKLAEKLEACIKTTLDTGTLASLEVDHKRTLRERLQGLTG